jgi:hypothetical protein
MKRSKAYAEGRVGEGNPNFRGYKGITHTFYSNTRASAIRRGFVFEITMQQMWELFESQKRKCALTGVDLTLTRATRAFEGNASLDRIDSSKGYTLDNIQWVEKQINRMKSNLTETRFLQYCTLVVSYLSTRV